MNLVTIWGRENKPRQDMLTAERGNYGNRWLAEERRLKASCGGPSKQRNTRLNIHRTAITDTKPIHYKCSNSNRKSIYPSFQDCLHLLVVSIWHCRNTHYVASLWLYIILFLLFVTSRGGFPISSAGLQNHQTYRKILIVNLNIIRSIKEGCFLVVVDQTCINWTRLLLSLQTNMLTTVTLSLIHI